MSDAEPLPPHLGEVVEGLARNPALPPELVRRLVAYRRGMGTVAKRPDLTDDVVAEILAADHHWLTHSLALNSRTPHAVRLVLAEHPRPAIRAALAVSGGVPREVFERLVDDPDVLVRRNVAESDDAPADVRARLADDPEPEVRATLARWWPQAPEAVRRRLLTDVADSVRAAACSTYYARSPHPVPPADLLPALLADPVTRAGAVRHCALGAEAARRLAADPDDAVREQVAEHPDLPARSRELLAEDPSPQVRVRVFARQDTPEATRAAIHAGILADANLPTWPEVDLDDEVVERQFMGRMARSELASLRLPWVTADPLPYVDSPYPGFRAAAAQADGLPAAVVARLLHDEDSRVRTKAAQHARDQVDPATAERIDRTYDAPKGSPWRPADDFPLPVSVLRRLASDPDPRMRLLAPRDPDLPAQLLGLLAADPDSTVRCEVAAHPRLPLGVLLELVADPSAWVAKAAAGNPSLPPAQMHRLLVLAGL
ncbi:hypothetical protein [Yinghuangia seranimata]|uniref:hypothetical protein n=1 Tax=Yinghuangia seranimata TaxID=408067 RepID=UPI00248CCAA5|nr:hypothetical protein [Yinghuangia seranimata]MDI2124580.1 hypothetical protein [Yinghuangia seranimata]